MFDLREMMETDASLFARVLLATGVDEYFNSHAVRFRTAFKCVRVLVIYKISVVLNLLH